MLYHLANERKATWLYRHLPLGFILGGALGNIIDRIIHGEVIDFLLVHYHDYHWPAFNIADAAILLGIALVLKDSFKK